MTFKTTIRSFTPKTYYQIFSITTSSILTIAYLYFLVTESRKNLEIQTKNKNNSANATNQQESNKYCIGYYKLSEPFKEINLLMTPASLFLIILFAFMNKRASCCLGSSRINLPNTFGLPAILSVFKKKDRFHYALGFSLIAFQVSYMFFLKIINSFDGEKTGLFDFQNEIVDVFFLGVLYYPLLTALSSRDTKIRVLGGLFAFYQLACNFIDYSYCFNILVEIIETIHKKELASILICSIYVVNSFISFYIGFHLTVEELFINLLSLKLKKKTESQNELIAQYSLVESDDLLFSIYDLRYCRDLLKLKSPIDETQDKIKLKQVFSRKIFSIIYKKVNKYLIEVYDPDSNFRYSLRFIFTQLICFITNFYTTAFLFAVSTIIFKNAIFNISDGSVDLENTLQQLNSYNLTFNLSFLDILKSKNTSKICYYVPIPPSLCSSDGIFLGYFHPKNQIDVRSLVVVSYVIANLLLVVLFFFQFVEGIRNYKKDFIELCKGKSKFQSIYDEISNIEIMV